MSDGDNVPTIAWLTTEIVVAYVSHHGVATADFGRLVTTVAQELGGLGHEPEPPAGPEPAVPVRRSVQRDRLVCLVCGKPFKSLRRHLQTAHDLTAESYRTMFGLARDYPMVAAASSEQRAEIARRGGLGQRRAPEQAPEPAVVAEAEVLTDTQPPRAASGTRQSRSLLPDASPPQHALKPVRGRRAAKKAEATAATNSPLQPQPEPEAEPKRQPRRKGESEPS